jgi:type 1 glutamine amidotransferase
MHSISWLRLRCILWIALALSPSYLVATAQGTQAVPPPPQTKQVHLKHVLVIGQTKGWEHESVTPAMVAIYNLGRQTGLWDTTLRTDTELITKKDLARNARNLKYFDLLIFASTTGEMDLDAGQKQDMLSFIKDDGKGFLGIHAALDSNYTWPEYGEMIGGYFDEHPWGTFNAPIINEAPEFPAVRHLPKEFVKFDEIYQPKAARRSVSLVGATLSSCRWFLASTALKSVICCCAAFHSATVRL